MRIAEHEIVKALASEHYAPDLVIVIVEIPMSQRWGGFYRRPLTAIALIDRLCAKSPPERVLRWGNVIGTIVAEGRTPFVKCWVGSTSYDIAVRSFDRDYLRRLRALVAPS